MSAEQSDADLKASKEVLSRLLFVAGDEEWAIEGLFLVLNFLASQECYATAKDMTDALQIHLYKRTKDFSKDFESYSQKIQRFESWKWGTGK